MVGWSVIFVGFGYAVGWITYCLVPAPWRWDRAYAVAAMGVVSLQAWDRIQLVILDLVAAVGEAGGWLAFAGTVTAISYLIILLIPAFSPSIRAVAGVATVFLIGVHLLSALLFGLQQLMHTPIRPAPLPATIVDRTPPDVLVLVLDGYGRSDVLSDYFGFENDPFIAELRSLGVAVVPKAKATYTMTALSVGGLLEGDYVATEQHGAALDVLHEIHSGNNRLFRSLDAAGYDIHMFDNAWTFTQCGSHVDFCYSGGLNELDDAVLARTPLPDLVEFFQIDAWTRGSVNQLTKAVDVARLEADNPKFIYLHALVPHPPFQLNANCETPSGNSISSKFVTNDAVSRARYVEQIKCTNSLVLELVSALPLDTVVFITGDHGPRWAGKDPVTFPDASDAEILNRLGIFTGYRLPQRCGSIPEDASLMTSAAHLFECLGIDTVVDSSDTPQFFTQSVDAGLFSVTDISELVSDLD